MNMQINRFGNGQLEQPTAQQVRPHAKNWVKNGAEKAGAGATDFAPTDAVRSEAGFKDGISFRSRSLLQRIFSPLRQKSQEKPSSQASRRNKYDKSRQVVSDDDLDEELFAPVMDTLAFLRNNSGRDGRFQVQDMLAEDFDPVQRYNVLAEALERVDNEPMSMVQKIALRNALMEMMSDLYEKHMHELRRALLENEVLVNSLEALAADEAARNLPSTRDLRFLIGAKSKGREDLPLTPLTMLKALIKNFGAHKCMKVMTGLRSRMMIGF